MNQRIDFQQTSDTRDMPNRDVVGSILYLLGGACRDISYAVARLAKYAESAKLLYQTCTKQIFCYLVETKELGLKYTQNAKLRPTIYSEANLPSDTRVGKSVSGMATIMGGAAIFWYSRQQEVIALSNTKGK